MMEELEYGSVLCDLRCAARAVSYCVCGSVRIRMTVRIRFESQRRLDAADAADAAHADGPWTPIDDEIQDAQVTGAKKQAPLSLQNGRADAQSPDPK